MSNDDQMVDGLIRTILRKDAPDEVKQNSVDLLRKIAADGSRAAGSIVRRLKFDTERGQWTLRSASEIPTSSRRSRTGRQERRLSNGRMTN